MEDVRIFESGNGDRGIDELAVHPGDGVLPPHESRALRNVTTGCLHDAQHGLSGAVRLRSGFRTRGARSRPRRVVRDDVARRAHEERARGLAKDSLSSLIDDDDWRDKFFGRYATEQKRARVDCPTLLEDSSREEDGDDPNINATAAYEWGDA